MNSRRSSTINQRLVGVFFVLVVVLVLLVALIFVFELNYVSSLNKIMVDQQAEIDRLTEEVAYDQREIERLEAVLHLPNLPKDCNGPSLADEIERVTGQLIKPRPTRSNRPAE
jgi:uncharacterized small protein (DUF1192 family)